MQAFVIPKENIPDFKEKTHLREFLSTYQSFARPPVSGYRVTALALGQSGQGYIGVNLEFKDQPLSQTVHAEQFAVCLAKHHGETGLKALAVTAMPCGHCRQFLLELGDPEFPITVVEENRFLQQSLQQLLPYPFILTQSKRHGLFAPACEKSSPNNLTDGALLYAFEMATQAYVPYTDVNAGITLVLSNSTRYGGFSLESAAYNPTLPPLQSALIRLVANHDTYSQICRGILVEYNPQKLSYKDQSQALLRSIAPQATFEHHAFTM